VIVVSVEVAALYIFPAASIATPPKERFRSHKVPSVARVEEALVEDAVSKTEVEEAKSETGEPVKRRAVPVAETDWPQKVPWVNGLSPEVAPVIVIGEEPIVTKLVHDADPAQVTVVVATDWYIPPVPPYKSCDTGAVVVPVPPRTMSSAPESTVKVPLPDAV
jgi:hypothetical protein